MLWIHVVLMMYSVIQCVLLCVLFDMCCVKCMYIYICDSTGCSTYMCCPVCVYSRYIYGVLSVLQRWARSLRNGKVYDLLLLYVLGVSTLYE